ncbi:MAG: hypothetical protein SGILL_003745 [Bacillariaceae sp.]
MKISPLASLALVALRQALAFVPNTCPSSYYSTAVSKSPYTATTSFASTFDTSVGGGSPTRFPYDEDAVRFAYDEWRLIYGKGSFDRYRFENFKTNYKTLTMANIQARDKALQTGTPAPQWMSLNEYGDYSVAEYEAMLEGRLAGEEASPKAKKAPFPVPSPSTWKGSNASYQYSNGVNGGDEMQDQYGRTIRSTEVVEPNARGTQVVAGRDSPRGTQVIQSASQQPAYDSSMSYSGKAMEEYQDQFGRTIRSTQVVQSSYPEQQPFLSSGTQVIQQSSEPRGTQVIASADANKRGETRGTQVVRNGYGAPSPRGTQVVQKSSGSNMSSFGRGTQVVSPNEGGKSFSYGTQVIQSSPKSGGTQVVASQAGIGAPSSYGTQVIKSSDMNGKQVMKGFGNTRSPGRGTLVISKDDTGTGSRYSNDLPLGDTDGMEASLPVEKRGTLVIKRQILEPEMESSFPNVFSIFGPRTEKKSETIILDKKPEKKINQEANSDGGLFGFFGDSKSSDNAEKETQAPQDKKVESEPLEEENSSIFSLFSGKQTSNNSRSVRGTIILPNAGKGQQKQAEDKRRKTVLIPKKTEENGLPSILSFFGGARKDTNKEMSMDQNTRPTLVIKKPKKPTWSLFPSSGWNDNDSQTQKATKV